MQKPGLFFDNLLQVAGSLYTLEGICVNLAPDLNSNQIYLYSERVSRIINALTFKWDEPINVWVNAKQSICTTRAGRMAAWGEREFCKCKDV